MDNNFFLHELRDCSKVVKTNLRKLVGYCWVNEIELNYTTIEHCVSELSKNDKKLQDIIYINAIKENLNSDNNEELSVLLEILVLSLDELRNYYYNKINSLDQMLRVVEQNRMARCFDFSIEHLVD